MPWRTVYEFYSLIGWCIAAVVTLGYLYIFDLPKKPSIISLFLISIFIGLRAKQSLHIWNIKLSLLGKGLLLKKTEAIHNIQQKNPTSLFAGYGFYWNIEHTQKLYDLKKVNPEDIAPPDWYTKMRGVIKEQSNDRRDMGKPFIHGVEVNEKEIFVPLSHLEGHLAIFGTTGSGKTRLFEFLVSQAIWRGDVIIVLDPKGDIDLRNRIENECKRANRHKDFAYFHPAFPTQSACFDAMSNYNRPTEFASRIAALLPAESPSDPFVAFNWRVCNIISMCLLDIEERPNLKKLRKFIEGGTDKLLESCLLHHFGKHGVKGWETQIADYKLRASEGQFAKPTKTTLDEIVAYTEFFKQEVEHYAPSENLSGLINMFFHDRTHLNKMITTLIPILDMLTSSDLGSMLSPDPSDLNETREILHSSKIVEGNRVFYMALDSLTDPVVGSAVASITIADLAATLGQIYNYSDGKRKRITLIVDEASAALSPPFIEIANKGRGAGCSMIMATQVISDFQSRLGSEAKARQLLGNFNNIIALRSTDGETQEYIIERFGKQYVGSLQYAAGTSSDSSTSFEKFSGNEGVRQSDELIETVPPDILGQLPNFHYFGNFSGGHIVKARIPIMTE